MDVVTVVLPIILLVLALAGAAWFAVWARRTRDPNHDPSVPDEKTGISDDDWFHAIR